MALTRKNLLRPKGPAMPPFTARSSSKVNKGLDRPPEAVDGSAEQDLELLAALSRLSESHLEMVLELVDACHRAAAVPPVVRRTASGSR